MRVRRMFIGQGGGARKGGGGGMAQREQKAVLADFRKGDIPQVSFPTAEVPLWWTWRCLMRARINAVALLLGALQVGVREQRPLSSIAQSAHAVTCVMVLHQ